MWEKDLLAQAQMLGESLLEETPSPQLRGWLRQQTQRARLIVYLGRNDPIKLTQVKGAQLGLVFFFQEGRPTKKQG